jgi:two-component system CheB/CheR fusion protein
MRRFAYVLAHDLKQPLNTIEGSVQALDEELPKTLDADIHELMRFLQQGTQRLKTRVNAVLDYARLQDQTTRFEPCDLAQIIDACLADLEDTVAQANAEIVVEPLPAVSGTPELLARLMRNLLSNALKFRDPARPLKITIAAINAPYGRVGLRVDDTGIGIAPQDRARVFELFSRLHVESEIEGSGLGLAMCDQIVSIHGGQLEVVEAETGGASFRFTLPAAPAAPDGA